MSKILELLEKEKEDIEMLSSRITLKTKIPMQQIFNEDTKLELSKLGIETFTLNYSELSMTGIMHALKVLSDDYLIGDIQVFVRKKPRYDLM